MPDTMTGGLPPAPQSRSTPSESTPLLCEQEPVPIPDDDPEAIAALPTNTVPDAGSSPLANEPSVKDLLKVLPSIWMGSLLAALDGSMVAVLSGAITASFNDLSLLAWVASAYFVANAALQPLAGKLTDIFGRRAGLIFSNVFFALGNLICGLAQSPAVFIFGRVVAGMGGGGLNAISTFVASDLVPLRRRGVWQGVGNVVFGLGVALGGVYGGVINDSVGWRWAFLILVPFTVWEGILVWFTVKIPVKESDTSRFRRIDFLGAITLTVSLVGLLVGLNSGGNVFPWSHPGVIVPLVLSVVFLVLFVWVEANFASEPIIPVRLLLHQTVWSACLTNWFVTMAHFSIIFYLPIYFQLQGSTSTEAGLRFLPNALGIAIGSLGMGLLIKWTGYYRVWNVINQSVYLGSLVLISTLMLDTERWVPLVYFFFTGAGYAGMLTISLVALIAAVSQAHQATITSASYAFRSTGTSIGITIASVVFQAALKSDLQQRIGWKVGGEEIMRQVLRGIEQIDQVPHEWRAGARDAYMFALRMVFVTCVALATVGALCSFFMRHHTLYANLARRDNK